MAGKHGRTFYSLNLGCPPQVLLNNAYRRVFSYLDGKSVLLKTPTDEVKRQSIILRSLNAEMLIVL